VWVRYGCLGRVCAERVATGRERIHSFTTKVKRGSGVSLRNSFRDTWRVLFVLLL
jgi:hypothetical protein